MCGIAGIVRVSESLADYEPIPTEWVDTLDAHIAWRGIDGAGRFHDLVTLPDGRIVEVALIHRRLSIIDRAGGAQPMIAARLPSGDHHILLHTHSISDHIAAHPDGIAVTDLRDTPEAQKPDLLALVFNGCIYNNAALRHHLASTGIPFQTTHSDTETLLRVFLHARDISRQRTHNNHPIQPAIDGMCAYALWDRSTANIATGRDPFGEKPLFRSLQKGLFAFASSHAALAYLHQEIRHPRRLPPLRIQRDAMELWIRYGFNAHQLPHDQITITPQEPEWFDHRTIGAAGKRSFFGILITILVGLVPISWLISAALGVFVIAAVIASAFTLFSIRHRMIRPSLTSGADVAPLLSAAVAERLESDEPIACLLSGGIDSSLVAYYAQQHTPITTISLRMPDTRYDESHHAQRVAEIIGSEHHTVDVETDPVSDLIHLIECIGLPFADSSILPTFWACRAASLHAKVLLTGDGADELFYGYDRYRAVQAMRFPASLLAHIFPSRWLGTDPDPKSRAARRRRFIEAARHAGYIDLISIFPTPMLNKLLPKRAGSFRLSEETMPEKSSSRPRSVTQARNWDLANYLPADILLKIDTASLASGVEARCPFLDNELSHAALTTPRSVHMRHGQSKHLLRELAATFLPQDLVDRPKQGFAIPIGDWFRSDYAGMRTLLMDLVAQPAARKHGRPFGAVHDALKINNKYIIQLIDEHFAAGDLPAPSGATRIKPRDHSQRLFLLITLAIWARTLERDPEID